MVRWLPKHRLHTLEYEEDEKWDQSGSQPSLSIEKESGSIGRKMNGSTE